MAATARRYLAIRNRCWAYYNRYLQLEVKQVMVRVSLHA
jgi:hypothetical protein